MYDIDSLKSQLEYIEETGWLRWKRTGKVAGCVDSRGYILVRVDGKLELAHRIIWAIKTNQQPPALVDHDDENKSNNRWDNLFENTKAGNGYNRRATKGAYMTPTGKWASHIHHNGHKIHLGTFDTEEQAEQVAANKRAEYLSQERQ